MSFQNFFPIWDQLQPHQQRQLLDSLTFQTVKRGAIVRGGNADCAGLLLIRTGQLRALYTRKRGGKSPSIACLTGISACFAPPASSAPSSLT